MLIHSAVTTADGYDDFLGTTSILYPSLSVQIVTSRETPSELGTPSTYSPMVCLPL